MFKLSQLKGLKGKLLLLFLVISFLPTAAVGAISYTTSINALQKQATNQLISIRESKKFEIENYFKKSKNTVSHMAQENTVINAIKDFKSGFNRVAEELNLSKDEIERCRSELWNYYNVNYYDLRNNKIHNIGRIEDNLNSDIDTTILKYLYVAANPNNIAEKYKYEAAKDKSSYTKAHKMYHPSFVNFLNKLNYNDVFLVDNDTGDIIYTALKELDFGTNLLNGPYKGSNLSKAFMEARNALDKEFVVLVDFEFLNPSNKIPSAFVAAPAFDGDKKIGVIILEMHISNIEEILTNNGHWEDMGLGNTGEIQLIGSDSLMRSNSRFINQEKDELITSMGTTILLKEIKTDASRDVLAGNTAVNLFKDFRGIPVIVSYTPLRIEGLDWSIIVKIDQTEAFNEAFKLRNLMLIISAFVLIVITITSLIIASSISNPMIVMSKIAAKVADGDLTVKMPEYKGNDEIGILMRSLGAMLSNIREQTSKILEVVSVLTVSVNEISVTLAQISTSAAQAASAVSETTATIEEVKQASYLSSQKTKLVSNAAHQSVETSEQGKKSVGDTIHVMNNIYDQMEAIAESIVVLSEKSQDISELIMTVDNLSEQSNLLAVNASIEAAKAGEHGKGFSVVAQEIRSLAEQSKQATNQVRSILKEIQKATNSAVMTTEKGIKISEEGNKQSLQAGDSIEKLSGNLMSAAQASVQIEASSQQQLIGMDQIVAAMEGVRQASLQNVESMKQMESASISLQEMGDKLKALLEGYKI